MKARVFSFAIVFTALLAFESTYAQNPHFVGNLRQRDLGTQLEVCFKIAGLGNNQNVTVEILSQGATASVVCINPGGNRAPGQDTQVNASGSADLTSGRNGQITDCVTTATPSISGADACPNPQWAARVTDVTFPSGTVVNVYDTATKELLLTYTFPSAPTPR